jgi:hypothetical protein
MLHAQDAVHFEFSDGIEDYALKRKMEQQISALLTAINRAESNSSNINYLGIDIDDLASQSIGMMWNNVHFRIVDDDIVEHCLRMKTSSGKILGYQVRNIAIEMKPLDDSYTGDLYQEVCINLDPKGTITDFNITLALNQYMRIVKEGDSLHDLDKRMQILYWVEEFRNAYDKKDIDFMEKVFSEDALIVTGKVMKRVDCEIPKPKVEYTTMGKQQYLANLRRVFARNSYINVHFDGISVRRHASKPNFYGVTLVQRWSSTTYSDEGIVFIIWDFSDEERPKILVRTWQPMEVDDNEVFKLKDFKL